MAVLSREDLMKRLNEALGEDADVSIMEEKGFLSVPMLEVDGKIMDFKDANDWINTLN